MHRNNEHESCLRRSTFYYKVIVLGCHYPPWLAQVSSLGSEVGMEIDYIGNMIAAEDSKFDLGHIHLEVPEGRRSIVLGRRWEI